jgi:hypothetical protein
VLLLVFDAGYDSAQLTSTSPTLQWRCWSGSAPTAASTPIHHRARPPPRARRSAVAAVAGPAGCTLDLDLAWRAHVRRFDLEHTVRFCKQTLGWATPRPRHPGALRLARAVADDQRLPWELPQPQPRLSPPRARRGFPQLLATLDSPASAPKPSRRSPGRPKGSRRGPTAPHPAIKKPATKPRKKASKAANTV